MCYLGVLDLEPQDMTYVIKKVNGVPRTSIGGLVEDYWFGHRIQHQSCDKVNVKLTEGYVIKTCKEINIGEELFLDYDRSLYCGKCHQEKDFIGHKFKKQMECMECRFFAVAKSVVYVMNSIYVLTALINIRLTLKALMFYFFPFN